MHTGDRGLGGGVLWLIPAWHDTQCSSETSAFSFGHFRLQSMEICKFKRIVQRKIYNENMKEEPNIF